MLNLDLLLERVDLVALAEHAGAKLKKSATNHRGACPLHGGDNTSAFAIYNRDVQIWQCHTACHKSGNAIHFVMAWKNLEFLDAVKWLADWAHIPLADLGLTPQAVAEHQGLKRRSDVLNLAANFYHAQLCRHYSAAKYVLRTRGFSKEAARRARFGFSNGAGLREYLDAQKADLALAQEIGLLRADGRDFTANAKGQQASPAGWLVYAHVERGNVVYLSARALSPVDKGDKSRNLPGPKRLYRAETGDRSRLLLVEGQACAETARQMNTSAWALCGTTLCDEDAAVLKQRKALYLFLDDDSHQPGTPEEKLKRLESARQRRTALAAQLGPLTMIGGALPEKDFNDWLRVGTLTEAALRDTLRQATPWVEMVIAEAHGCPAHELDERAATICALLNALPRAAQSKYISAAEAALGISAGDIRKQMKHLSENGSKNRALVKEGQITFDGQPLANFSATITHEMTVDDGMNPPSVRYNVTGELATGDDRRLRPLDIPADEFDAMRWPTRWGVRAFAFVSPSQYWLLCRAIKELSVTVARERIHTYTGMTTLNGQRAFLTASGAITADGFDSTVRVELSNNLKLYALPAPPEDPRAALQASLEFLELAPYAITIPLWCAMYASVLTTSRYSLDAVLWIYGKTQSLKSSLAILALTHFGKAFVSGRKFKAPMDWISTVTSLEGGMFTAKDLAVVIDDYAPQPSAHETQIMRDKANRVIRSVGNRASRGRAQGDLTERANRPPRGLVIVTAELEPSAVQSIEGRLIVLPVAPGDVRKSVNGEDSPLDRAQQLAGETGPGLYAQAMSAHVRDLLRHWDARGEEMTADHEQAIQTGRREFTSSQSRLIDYYAVLLTAGKRALKFQLDSNALSRPDYERLAMQVFPATMLTVLKAQSERTANRSPVRRFCEGLSDLLSQGRVYLAKMSASETLPPNAGAFLVGWYDPEAAKESIRYIYLSTNLALGQVREYWFRVGEPLDILPDSLRREMSQVSLVHRKDDRQFEASVWMGKAYGNKRVLITNATLVEELYGVSVYPEDGLWASPDGAV